MKLKYKDSKEWYESLLETFLRFRTKKIVKCSVNTLISVVSNALKYKYTVYMTSEFCNIMFHYQRKRIRFEADVTIPDNILKIVKK